MGRMDAPAEMPNGEGQAGDGGVDPHGDPESPAPRVPQGGAQQRGRRHPGGRSQNARHQVAGRRDPRRPQRETDQIARRGARQPQQKNQQSFPVLLFRQKPLRFGKSREDPCCPLPVPPAQQEGQRLGHGGAGEIDRQRRGVGEKEPAGRRQRRHGKAEGDALDAVEQQQKSGRQPQLLWRGPGDGLGGRSIPLHE